MSTLYWFALTKTGNYTQKWQLPRYTLFRLDTVFSSTLSNLTFRNLISINSNDPTTIWPIQGGYNERVDFHNCDHDSH
jgi:hypothetical protein